MLCVFCFDSDPEPNATMHVSVLGPVHLRREFPDSSAHDPGFDLMNTYVHAGLDLLLHYRNGDRQTVHRLPGTPPPDGGGARCVACVACVALRCVAFARPLGFWLWAAGGRFISLQAVWPQIVRPSSHSALRQVCSWALRGGLPTWLLTQGHFSPHRVSTSESQQQHGIIEGCLASKANSSRIDSHL